MMTEGGLSDLHDGEDSLVGLNDHDKGDLPIVGILPSSSTPYSLPQNCLGIVLVDTSPRTLQLAIGTDHNTVDYSHNAYTCIDIPDRALESGHLSIPDISHQIPTSDIDEESVGHVYHTAEGVCTSLEDENLLHQTELTDTQPEAELASTNKPENHVKKKGGWPKGKRRKEVPELVMPKAPSTGYVSFALQRRAELKIQHPEISFSNITKLLGSEWTNLDPERKQKYLDEAEEMKRKYHEELKLFRESDKYKNFLRKKRKASSEKSGEDGTSPKDQIEEDVCSLYCDICEMSFTSSHNKKEHLFGRLHLQNMSGEIQRLEKSKQAEEEVQTISDEPECEQTDRPLDINGFINSFRAQNHDRQIELVRLKQVVKEAKEENNNLFKQMTELKLYESRLNANIEASKQCGQTLINQSETLKIIASSFSAMFGLVNYDV